MLKGGGLWNRNWMEEIVKYFSSLNLKFYSF
jgi:hypothetical protein